MVNQLVFSEECSAVAFYGFSASVTKTEALYHRILNWFNAIGCPPDKIGVNGPGFSKNLVSFSRTHNRLIKRGFEGVDLIEVIASTPGAKTGHDFLAKASYNCTRASMYMGMVARSSFCLLTDQSMLPVVRQVTGILRPSYGIGFTREHRFGPELYVVGINYGGSVAEFRRLSNEEYEAKRTISRWGDFCMPRELYRQGLLRDIYRWNFLSSAQMMRSVCGMPLEKWIREKTDRGKIRSVDGDLVLWEVEDAQIADIRNALQDAGAIFDWRTYEDSTTV